MLYLIFEIVLCLIAAALLGLLAGWALWARQRPLAPRDEGMERELAAARERIRVLEHDADVQALTPVADPTSMQAEPRLDPLPPPPPRQRPAPLAAEVYQAEMPVSPLDPIFPPEADEPGEAEPEGGDGPAEAAFTDEDLPSFEPLAAPQARAASPAYDDLKRISGIGPAIESQLAEIGVTTYRQIAHFTEDDIERVGAHIDFFADRIRREGWVVQAAALHRQTYGTRP